MLLLKQNKKINDLKTKFLIKGELKEKEKNKIFNTHPLLYFAVT